MKLKFSLMKIHTVSSDWVVRLRDDWTRLEESAPGVSIFQTWEWVSTWWKHFGQGKEPRILVGKDNQNIVGIAPLCITKTLGLRRLQWMGTGISDHLGELVLPGHEEEFAEAVLNEIETNTLADLHEMSEESPLLSAARKRNWFHLKQDSCPYIPLKKTNALRLRRKIDRYLGYERRRAERRLGKIAIEQASEKDLDLCMELLFDLHTKRWKRRGFPGEFRDPRAKAFHKEWARLCHQNGWLRLYTLQAPDRIYAVLYVFHRGGHAYHYMSGLDARVKHCSPGSILTAQSISNALEEGCTVFDFLRGAEPHKMEWHPELKPNVRLCHGQGILGQLMYRWISWRNKR